MLSLVISLLFFLTLFVILFVVGFEIYKKFNHDWQVFMKLPGPKPIIFFGNVLQLPATIEDMFRVDITRAQAWPEMHRFSMGHMRVLICYNADDIEHFISGHGVTEKPFIYEFLHPWLGTGLLTSEGDKWQTRRKMLTPAFHFNILQGFLKIFHTETEHLVKVLHEHCHKDYINVVPFISDFALSSINDTAMGISSEGVENGRTYKTALCTLSELLAYRIMRPWFASKYVWSMTPSHWKERRLLKTLHEFTRRVIWKREKSFDWSQQEIDDFSYSTRKKLVMMDLLLSQKRNGAIDLEGIREEVDTFMFEGHDTVSMAICYALLVLANYKTAQDEIRREMYDVLGNKDNPGYEDLNQLTYMERCIKEVLRLYPSVGYIFRNTIKQGLSKTGRTYPKNTLIMIEIYNLHRDTKYFPDPEKFDPDRFLPENCKSRHPFAYLPFSAGPRNCIGQKYAMLEIKAVLYGILREFNLEPVHRREDIVIKPDLVLRPNEDGIRVKFVPRKKTE